MGTSSRFCSRQRASPTSSTRPSLVGSPFTSWRPARSSAAPFLRIITTSSQPHASRLTGPTQARFCSPTRSERLGSRSWRTWMGCTPPIPRDPMERRRSCSARPAPPAREAPGHATVRPRAPRGHGDRASYRPRAGRERTRAGPPHRCAPRPASGSIVHTAAARPERENGDYATSAQMLRTCQNASPYRRGLSGDVGQSHQLSIHIVFANGAVLGPTEIAVLEAIEANGSSRSSKETVCCLSQD